MVIPADPEEMKQFQQQCVAQCQCAVDISLPLAYILLPSKQAFQSIYNRCGCWVGANIVASLHFVNNVLAHEEQWLHLLFNIVLVFVSDLHLLVWVHMDPFFLLLSWRINNDLLMWEPPPPATHSPEHSRHHQDEFQLCKSAFRLGEFPQLPCCNIPLWHFDCWIASHLRLLPHSSQQTQIQRRMSLTSTWPVNHLEGSDSYPPDPNTTSVCCPSQWWSAKDVSKPEQTRRRAVRPPAWCLLKNLNFTQTKAASALAKSKACQPLSLSFSALTGRPDSWGNHAWPRRGEDIQRCTAPKQPKSQFSLRWEQTSGVVP